MALRGSPLSLLLFLLSLSLSSLSCLLENASAEIRFEIDGVRYRRISVNHYQLVISYREKFVSVIRFRAHAHEKNIVVKITIRFR